MTQLNLHTMPAEQRRAYLRAVRAAGRGRRVYALTATGPRMWPVTPVPSAVASQARIRAVVCVMFRKVFGRAPTFTWAAPGRQAEAWDDRGYRMHLHQLNDLPG